MINLLKRHRFLSVTITLLILSISAGQAADRSYGEQQLTFQKMEVQKDGNFQVTFRAQPESVYYCPGVNAKTTKKGVELTFVRSWYKKKPKVDYPVKFVKGAMFKVVTVPAKGGAVFLRDGKHLVQLHPKNS